jgi:hypothetical protein
MEALVMNMHWLAGGAGRFLTAVALAGALIGIGPAVASASASACVSWTGTPPVNPSNTGDSLAGVSVLSPCNVWAVGNKQAGATFTLAEHFDGTGWTAFPSSNPSSTTSEFTAVAAISSQDALAVGGYVDSATAYQTLIEVFSNGVWEQIASPDPGGSANDNFLTGVAIISAKNAWAVGSYSVGHQKSPLRTLIVAWNGITWSVQTTPTIVGSLLNGVAASSAKNAWAVGAYTDSPQFVDQTLIEHWDGTKWRRVSSPNPGGPAEVNTLTAVAVSSPSNAWAVGHFATKGGSTKPLIERWNGKAWKSMTPASLDGGSRVGALTGVTIVSATDAWAVGQSGSQTLIARWDGKTWNRVPSPNPGNFAYLAGVGSSSATDVWAAGYYSANAPDETLAVHCC